VATTLPQSRSASPAKYDAAVEVYLARARGRIRSLDALVGVLVLGSGVLAFMVAMVLADRWLVLSPLSRQLALAGFVVAALVYTAFGLVLPLCRQINPYFAARHLEQVVPGSKNSVVNWLDLHREPLPPAIRAALGQRALHDLANADLEQAISGRRAAWLGGLTAALALAALVTMALLGARPFFSLLGRTFAPFREGAIATRTSLTLVQPEGGNVTVPVGRPVRVAVEVDGRVPEAGKPDAIRLQFHYQPGDPDEERPLERENGDVWAVTVPAFQVQNGFWYRVAGGDTETPEYRVQVRATPLVTGYEATYHYRPYLGWRDDTTTDATLRALRGTEVRLVAHTNRTVRLKDSRLEIDVPRPGPAAGAPAANQRVAADAARVPDTIRKTVAAEAVPGDPQALAFRLVLEESGKYRVLFFSAEGEANTDPPEYSIQVLQDHAPLVELTKPGQDVTLPANGLLALEGVATDDIGITGMTLHLRVADGPEFRPQPYRDGKSFKLAEGGYPRTLQYRDFVELNKLQSADGKAVKLEPKTVLEYWLEATDDCDYPGPNVGKSRTYKVTIGEPDADQKKQEQQRQQAKQEQQKHETKQDEQMKKEGQQPRQDTNPDHPQQNPQEQAKGGGQNDKSQPDKPDNQQNQGQKSGEGKKDGQNQPEQKDNPGKKDGEQKDNPGKKAGEQQNNAGKNNGQQPKEGGENNRGQQAGAEQPGRQDPREQQAERLAKAAEQQQREQRGGAKDDPAKEPKGQQKPGGAGQSRPDAGQRKDGNPGAQGAAQNKDAGHQGQAKPDAGQAKDQNPNGAGEQRPQAGKKNEGAGTAKPEPQAGAHGEKKDGGQQGAGQEPKAAPKEGGPEKAGGAPKAESKPAGDTSKNGGTPQGEAKKDAAEANARDVQRLAEQMRQGDEKQSQSAEKKLEQVSREAKDPAARQAAQKALEQRAAEKKQESAAGAAKSEPKSSDPKNGSQSSAACQCKGGGTGSSQAGQSKGGGSGQGSEARGATKGQGAPQVARRNPSQQGTGSEQGNKPGDENAPGSSKPGPGNGQPGKPGDQPSRGTGGGGTPGERLTGGRPQPGNAAANDQAPPEEAPPPDRPAPNQPKRAGELVLEDLRKTLDYLKKHPQEMKQVLKRANLEERDVRDVEDYLNEKLPAPQQTGTLSNLGARQAATGKTDTSGARATTQAGPPPGYRNPTREFTRQLNQTDKD
jgi:hypothetical protein